MPCGFQTNECTLSHQQLSLLSSSQVINSLPGILPPLCHLLALHTLRFRWEPAIVPSSKTTLHSLMLYHILEGHREKTSPEHDLLQTDFPLLKYSSIFSFSTYCLGAHELDSWDGHMHVCTLQVCINKHIFPKDGYSLIDDFYLCLFVAKSHKLMV